jgi:hypothetical protein
MQWKDSGGGDFETAPAGTHIARCIKLIDVGTQHGEYQGKPTRRRQCMVVWELPNELIQTGEFAGKPFTASKIYTQSLSEKSNLRHDLVNWRGRDFTDAELSGFDARNILGKPCMVTLSTKPNGKTKVTGVSAVPKGFETPPQVNPVFYFSLDEFDKDAFDSMSEKMRAWIARSDEYVAMTTGRPNPPPFDEFPDDDIPF